MNVYVETTQGAYDRTRAQTDRVEVQYALLDVDIDRVSLSLNIGSFLVQHEHKYIYNIYGVYKRFLYVEETRLVYCLIAPYSKQPAVRGGATCRA